MLLGSGCISLNPRCHQLGQPGHGPNFRLTYKVNGMSISESLPTLAAIQEAEREVAEFRKFRQLSREFVQTNRWTQSFGFACWPALSSFCFLRAAAAFARNATVAS